VCQTLLIKLWISELLASRIIGKKYSCAVQSLQNTLEQTDVHQIDAMTVQFSAKFSYGTAERRMLPLIL
jgi:hypothetical protein